MWKLQSDLQARSHDLEFYILYVLVIPRNPYDVNSLCNIETPLDSHPCLDFTCAGDSLSGASDNSNQSLIPLA